MPEVWADGVIEDVEIREDGLRDVLIRHADGTIGRELIGKRGGGKVRVP
jgi:hypothetical protein